MEKNKNIALVAHDNRKKDLIEWVEWNCRTLLHHHLICTGTTGKLIEKTLAESAVCEESKYHEVRLTKLKSGPLGGDQQLGAMITEGKTDFMISSPLMNDRYEPALKDYEEYINREFLEEVPLRLGSGASAKVR